MAVFTFIGAISDLANMTAFMPGLSQGLAGSGSFVVQPSPGNPSVLEARFQVFVGAHEVTARSIGLDPVAAFQQHTPTGPLASPTIQQGYIDNVFLETGIVGSALGRVGFTVQGPGSPNAGHVTLSIFSITVVPPETL